MSAELAWEPAIKATAVGVSVKDGVVTLTGHIGTFAEKHRAARAVRRVSGVKAIALELDVKLSPEHRRSDTDIAAACETALGWNTWVPAESVRLTVDHGWVTLQGEVEWQYQRDNAEKAIRPLTGVVGVSNEIKLRAKPQPAELARKIEDALLRQAEREAQRIHVEIDGATVKLTGKVRKEPAHRRYGFTGRGARPLIPPVLQAISHTDPAVHGHHFAA